MHVCDVDRKTTGVPIPPALYCLDLWDTNRKPISIQSSTVLLPGLADNFPSAILVQALVPLRDLDEQHSMSPGNMDDDKERAHPHNMLANSGKPFLMSLMTSYFRVSDTDHRHLRPYDTAPSTRRTCVVSLVLSGILALSGLTGTVAVGTALANAAAADELSDVISAGLVSSGVYGQAALFTIPLVFATIVTFCSESLGLVHTTSLRWALWRECRLDFNTNLRLMTQAHTSKPNHWIVNLYVILVTAVTYTTASQVFIVNQFTTGSEPELHALTFSVTALAVMTFGLFL